MCVGPFLTIKINPFKSQSTKGIPAVKSCIP